MANPQQLALLRRGAREWNKWRIENFRAEENQQLDLSAADLSGWDLTGAMLADTNFQGALLRGTTLRRVEAGRANFQQADCQGANLSEADFQEADLRQANFARANLLGTYFSLANLCQASFRDTNLMTVIFVEADLHGADFTNGTLGETIFGNTNLTGIIGLESCRHNEPSVLDVRTIMKSGMLPLNFLRGCGLPDNLIDYLPALLNDPIRFHSCFISYSNKDEAFARRLHADLQDRGVRCWFAPEDMKIGDEFRSRIDQAIHLQDRLLLILSEQSVKSRWVQKEVETAFEKEDKENRLVLFPIRLDAAVMDATAGWAADVRRQRHIGDFTHWKDHDAYQKSFARLLRDLKATEAQKEEEQ